MQVIVGEDDGAAAVLQKMLDEIQFFLQIVHCQRSRILELSQ